MRGKWVWYPYLEKPFPWAGLALFTLPPLLIITAVVRCGGSRRHHRRYIRDQLGPSHPTWPSLGKNSKGQERDAFKAVKDDVAAMKTKLVG